LIVKRNGILDRFGTELIPERAWTS